MMVVLVMLTLFSSGILCCLGIVLLETRVPSSKKNTNAKRRFEDLCNQDDLEEKLKHAMRNSTAPEAKLLSKEFTSLINVLGGIHHGVQPNVREH